MLTTPPKQWSPLLARLWMIAIRILAILAIGMTLERTNVIETSAKDYSSLPSTYKNMLVRLEQGEYLIQNPIFRSLLKINFPKPIYKQFK